MIIFLFKIPANNLRIPKIISFKYGGKLLEYKTADKTKFTIALPQRKINVVFFRPILNLKDKMSIVLKKK